MQLSYLEFMGFGIAAGTYQGIAMSMVMETRLARDSGYSVVCLRWRQLRRWQHLLLSACHFPQRRMLYFHFIVPTAQAFQHATLECIAR